MPVEERLRRGFKYFNRFMLLLWRLGLGAWVNAWPALGGRIMVLVHTGRRSGRRRFTPLNYAIISGDVYCLAGFGSGSDWYRNILAQPQVELWLPEGWWAATAEELAGAGAQSEWLRAVLLNSGLAARAAGIDPLRITDEALRAATATYHLIRLRRTAARTGAGGPGELAWVWPVATVLLLLWLALS
ncbi:MAG: nitroreductase family deazaflavin-dependent oxidoreductase [Deltaproteobacteria bacterium]|nr:nitroreductase family deazaflavin-dependent oxidoreductase [Deltaproteobacteria bacterium]